MEKKSHYTGFFSKNEVSPDNRSQYADKDDAHSRKMMEFYAKFPPGIPRDRLVGHKVEVFEYSNLVWQKTGKTVIWPVGDLEKVFEIDLGQELLVHLDERSWKERVVREDVVYEINDGMFIRGDIIERVSLNEDLLEPARKYFEIDFFSETGYKIRFHDPTLDQISHKEIREFRVTTYVKYNDELCSEKIQFVRPTFFPKSYHPNKLFQRESISQEPDRFNGWRFTQN